MDKNEEDDEYEERSLSEETSQELLDLIAELEQDPEFEQELVAFIEAISKDDFDLSALQSKILLLIKPIVEKSMLGKDAKKKIAELKKDQELLRNKVRDLSFYFTVKRSVDIEKSMQGIDGPKDVQAHLNSQSLNALKNEMKRHAIYEVYKMTNPRRIAGETRKDNFVGNYVTKGEKVARKHEGGSKEEMKKYAKDGTLKKAVKARKKFLGKGGMM